MSEPSIISNLYEQFSDVLLQHRRPLPDICNAEALIQNPPDTPAELVRGILHQGSKLVLGGSSKSFKTWTLLDLALSVQAGLPWWGFDTYPADVLYINFEIQEAFIAQRIQAIKEARQIADVSRLDTWNLRGHSAPLEELVPRLLSPIRDSKYGLIVLDPIYKTLGGRNESDAGDIGEFCNEIEKIAVETGAAVAFGAHFAKGNASQKASIDRISGSGVFARDPDSILTLTKHEIDGAFAVEMTLRNFLPREPFCVRWEYPLMRRDKDLNPKDLKQPKGRRKEFHASMLLGLLIGKELSLEEWRKKAEEEFGIRRSTFFRLKRELVEEGAAKQTKDGKWMRCG